VGPRGFPTIKTAVRDLRPLLDEALHVALRSVAAASACVTDGKESFYLDDDLSILDEGDEGAEDEEDEEEELDDESLVEEEESVMQEALGVRNQRHGFHICITIGLGRRISPFDWTPWPMFRWRRSRRAWPVD